MTTFETILYCILIPVSFVLVYIAGKHDILNLIGDMIEDAAKEMEARKTCRESVDYLFGEGTEELLDKAKVEIGDSLYYDTTTRIVYWWNGHIKSDIAIAPTPYYAPNGLPYRYNPETNTFEEIG